MRVLRLLLWLLPGRFRREFGEEILQAVAEQRRELGDRTGAWDLGEFWLRQWLGVLRGGMGLRRGRGVLGAADERYRHLEGASLDSLGVDFRHAVRSLRAQPGFTAMAILTLALGVGATTAMVSTVRGVLLRPLPFPSADELLVVQQTEPRGGVAPEGLSAADVRDLARSSSAFEGIAGAEAHGLRLKDQGRAYSLRAWLVSEGFFATLGTGAVLGRTFHPDEYVAGRDRVVLLGYSTWQQRFGGEPGVLGRQLELDGVSHTVVGVLPTDFAYPSSADLWAPRVFREEDLERRSLATMDVIGRRGPGVSHAEAQAELDARAVSLARAHPETHADLGLEGIPLEDSLVGEVRRPLWLLFGAVLLVLMIAVGNVAGLQLARGAGRTREVALRSALGASSLRLMRLMLIEGLLLAGVAGLLGIGLARLALEVLEITQGELLPRSGEIAIDGLVVLVALGTALLAAGAAALAPSLRPVLGSPREALADGHRGSTGGPTSGRFRDRLVVAEIALALVLAIGAGLLVRSFDRLLGRPLGFDPTGRLAVQVWAYDDEHRERPEFFDRGVEALAVLPGVEAVGLTTTLPLADDRSLLARSWSVEVELEDRPESTAPRQAGLAVIDGGYVEALGVPVVAGREFSTLDHRGSEPVVMVNETLARRWFPDRAPIGRRLKLDWRDGSWRRIVGVLADVRREGFESEPRPEVYVPLSQEAANGLTFVVRSSSEEPRALIGPVREALWGVDPNQATWAVQPMTDLLSGWSRQRRFHTGLLFTFALLAVGLAAVGIYGLMAFAVSRRTAEFGIRRALGGQGHDLFALVLRQGLTVALSGVVLGLLGALAFARLLRGLLFGVPVFDVPTFVGLALFLVLVALLAIWIPAHRATRVDPGLALRSD